MKNIKTVKISKEVHKALTIIKNLYGYKTLDETIDMCIGEFAHQEQIENQLKDVYKQKESRKMSILEIILYAIIGVATVVWCTVMIVKAVRKKKGKITKEDED